jgi:hypothetical protein
MFDKKNKKVMSAYKDIFNTDSPQAISVLNDMCRAHGVFDGGFDPDPYINAFNSGERNTVLRILTILKMEPTDIIDLTNKEGY